MTLNEIRQQLKTIRLYYTNKARFSAAFNTLPHTVKELADKLQTSTPLSSAPRRSICTTFTMNYMLKG